LAGLSPGLTARLLAAGRSDGAIDDVASDPQLYAEVRAALPSILAARDAAVTPATPEQIMATVGRFIPRYPQQDRGEGEWEVFWEGFLEVLEGQPALSIEKALKAWARTPERFLPNPGQLLELCQKVEGREVIAAYRAQKIVERPPPLSEEQKAARRADVKELLAGMDWKKSSDRPL